MTEFNKRLKELREESFVSMNELAKAIGVSGAAVCKWENGIAEPKATYIVRLADYFGCSADYLLGRTDDYKAAALKTLSNIKISTKERNMFHLFRMLSPEMQGLIISAIESTARLEKYARHNSSDEDTGSSQEADGQTERSGGK